MKRRSRAVVLAGIALVLLASAGTVSDPLSRQLLLGQATLLRHEISVTGEVDGHRLEAIRCFAEPGRFGGPASQRLVLWMDDTGGTIPHRVLIVDLDNGKVIVPNASQANYRLLGRRWLAQSDSGAEGVLFGDPKLDARDPGFQRSADTVSFTVPAVLNLPSGQWSLRLAEGG
jgi:hypothetical protein